MTALLLNSPYWLIVILAVIGVAVLFSRLPGGDAGGRKISFVLLALAALLLVLRMTVPTPEKKVERQARALMNAIGNNDWATVNQLTKRASLRFGQKVENTFPVWEGDEIAKEGKRKADF